MTTKFIGVFGGSRCFVAELELNYPGGQRIILNEANLRKRLDSMVPPAGAEENKALTAMLVRKKSDGGKVA